MAMKPGRDLDREIAASVLGMRLEWDFENSDWAFQDRITKQFRPLPNFSTNTNDVYIVINFLQTKGFYNNVGSSSGKSSEQISVWRCSFHRQGGVVIQATGDTLPHAVCLAALKLVIPEKPKKPTQVNKTGNVVKFPGSDEKVGKVIQFPTKNDK